MIPVMVNQHILKPLLGSVILMQKIHTYLDNVTKHLIGFSILSLDLLKLIPKSEAVGLEL